jgi:hypothetical protein
MARVCNIILQDFGENKKNQITHKHRITRPPFWIGIWMLASLTESHNVRVQNVVHELS